MIFSLLFLSLIFFNSKSALSDEIYLRVAVLKDISSATIEIKSHYRILLPFTNQIIEEGRHFKKKIIKASINGVRIGKQSFNTFSLDFYSKKDGRIYLNKNPYRGIMRVIKKGDKLLFVNIIDLETYLNGVIQNEISGDWPMEAIKAQVIAARSYALYVLEENKNKDYDLESNVLHQVYHGKIGERWRIRRAIRLTKGLVLVYKNKILPAFYHATCGGHTDNAKHLWDIDLYPLRGVSCDFCKDSPYYRWEKIIDLDILAEKLKKRGIKVDKIKNVFVLNRYDTGYVKNIEIDSDKKIILNGKKFREILGFNYIKSRRFLLKVKDNKLKVKGFGWGHGIGQWGAREMAKRGYNAEEILKYYYPGAEIRKLTNY
jgi:stage II sporulation protein D